MALHFIGTYKRDVEVPSAPLISIYRASVTEEPRNKASAHKENPPIKTWIFSPQIIVGWEDL